MGKKTSEAAKFNADDFKYGLGAAGVTRIYKKGKASGDDMSPEMPGETPEERSMRNRQAETLAKLDEDENRRIKGIMQGTLGTRLLRNARSTAKSSGVSGAAASASSGSSGGAVTRATGGGARSKSLID